MTLPPGTWALSFTAALDNEDSTIGQFTCFVVAGSTGHVHLAASVPVDIMGINLTQTTTYASAAASALISVSTATPAFAECASAISNAHSDGDVDSSNLTATRVTDPHGAMVVVN